jgi:DNA-binding NarL/FixJ family response regulator
VLNTIKSTPRMRVAVVDDDVNICLCLKDILQSAENFMFAGSFSNASGALAGIPRLSPDLTLMDIRLPDLNGIECTKILKRILPLAKIIIVTGTHDANLVDASLQAGALAYLIKPFEEDQLLATLRFAAVSQAKAKPNKMGARITPFSKIQIGTNLPLNPREKEVLMNLAEGLLYKEISDILGISYSAVHKCLNNVYKKLRVSNRTEAVRVWLDSRGK